MALRLTNMSPTPDRFGSSRLARSTPTAVDGQILPWLGNAMVTHVTPLAERWGGWHRQPYTGRDQHDGGDGEDRPGVAHDEGREMVEHGVPQRIDDIAQIGGDLLGQGACRISRKLSRRPL